MSKGMNRAVAAAAVAFACAAGAASGGVELKSETAKTSYALGYQIGGDFKRQQVDLDAVAAIQGIADARSGTQPAMSEEAMRSILIDLKHKVVAQQQAAAGESVKASTAASGAQDAAPADAAGTQTAPHARRAAARASTNAKELSFIERNAKREGVVTLASGLQYKVQKEGSGRQPQATDKVALIYRGSLASGEEFANSDKDGKAAPRVLPVASLVPGLREALSLMKEGARWEVVVPPQLGFNAATPLYRKVTVFDLELVAVNP